MCIYIHIYVNIYIYVCRHISLHPYYSWLFFWSGHAASPPRQATRAALAAKSKLSEQEKLRSEGALVSWGFNEIEQFYNPVIYSLDISIERHGYTYIYIYNVNPGLTNHGLLIRRVFRQ